ncbi:hypothetical protein HYZ80_02310 [Candidatus Parcubacteria bacterium]|nr:hypothetical protein [Candidatus Parcubacteria bacterium]
MAAQNRIPEIEGWVSHELSKVQLPLAEVPRLKQLAEATEDYEERSRALMEIAFVLMKALHHDEASRIAERIPSHHKKAAALIAIAILDRQTERIEAAQDAISELAVDAGFSALSFGYIKLAAALSGLSGKPAATH